MNWTGARKNYKNSQSSQEWLRKGLSDVETGSSGSGHC